MSFIFDYFLLSQPKTSILDCLICKNISLITSQSTNYICESTNHSHSISSLNRIFINTKYQHLYPQAITNKSYLILLKLLKIKVCDQLVVQQMNMAASFLILKELVKMTINVFYFLPYSEKYLLFFYEYIKTINNLFLVH